MPRPALIDTDPGIDDALALLVALASPEIRVEAITTVAGNVDVDTATANVGRILDVVRRSAGPAFRMPLVARGAASPLTRSLVTAAHVHGDDGLGNLERFRFADGRPRYPAPAPVLMGSDAADVILDAAERFAGELVLIALGPLTNVALALQRDHRRLGGLSRLVVMGGAAAVAGNVTPAAEFNVFVDPEAAAGVVEAGLPLEVVPLDVTRRVTLSRPALEALLGYRSDPRAEFLRHFTAHGFDVAERRGDGGIVLHDPLAVAVAVDPSLVGFERLHVAVECAGRHTLGATVADRRPGPPERRLAANCAVAMTVDATRALDLITERLCPASV